MRIRSCFSGWYLPLLHERRRPRHVWPKRVVRRAAAVHELSAMRSRIRVSSQYLLRGGGHMRADVRIARSDTRSESRYLKSTLRRAFQWLALTSLWVEPYYVPSCNAQSGLEMQPVGMGAGRRRCRLTLPEDGSRGSDIRPR